MRSGSPKRTWRAETECDEPQHSVVRPYAAFAIGLATNFVIDRARNKIGRRSRFSSPSSSPGERQEPRNTRPNDHWPVLVPPRFGQLASPRRRGSSTFASLRAEVRSMSTRRCPSQLPSLPTPAPRASSRGPEEPTRTSRYNALVADLTPTAHTTNTRRSTRVTTRQHLTTVR